MRRLFPLVTLFTAFIGFAAPHADAFEWRAGGAEANGFSSEGLEALRLELERNQTDGVVVVRNDRVVLEWYSKNSGPDKPHYTASLAKALVGGLSLMVAMQDGLVSPDDPASRYIPEWRGDDLRAQITLRQLATHSSGVEDAHSPYLGHFEMGGWKTRFWNRDPDPFSIARDWAPLRFKPGTAFEYSNTGMAMLSYAITAALKDAPQHDVRTLLRDRIMRPIGVKDDEWSIGYGKTYEVNGLPLVANWGGGNYTARAAARVGRLILHHGDWDGERILSPETITSALADAGTPAPFRGEPEGPAPRAGLAWWVNTDGVLSRLPMDAVMGAGAGNQVLLIAPSLNLVAVRFGGLIDPDSFWGGMEEHFFNPLIAAMTDVAQPPRPPSPAIERAVWAPAREIVRMATGSDNWPLTWGDDDRLYTAYGDGNGFKPFTGKKLSMGFARVSGSPPGLTGENIRSESGETIGDGPRARKASGIIMVDGVLYLWARNAANAQLAWSEDHGETWRWSDWKFETGFGAPTFINFGRNNENARDEFVYLVSHDNDSAYEPADRMVMARVPADRILERSAYEFFESLGENNSPRWTKEINKRGAVFVHTGKCYRSGISWNPGLRRYLWLQTLPKGDARFEGGFGLYDAPEPWGPWTTVYLTQRWDVGPGESSSLPVKWMSPDGRSAFMVFSGSDAFSVRQVDFILRE
ncbi:MAG: serine hydrolase [bacterium]|nr:serine hydrolase [bacterium]